MKWIIGVIRRARLRKAVMPDDNTLQIDTARGRQQRELARSQGQAGHNLTVQTTIDMARTQTWTGGG